MDYRAMTMGPPGQLRSRRAYAPRRFPRRRATWTPDAVVDALREWAAECGSPPRRQDWSGEGLGRVSAAQRKWMAEHPRWPSASRVAAHHGSWGAGLRAAGLEARTLPRTAGAAERVAAAHRMAAGGHSASAIADALEVSKATIYNYLRAVPCPACGAPMVRRDAASCTACARSVPTVNREWTQGEIRAALHAWRLRYGSAPTCREWTPRPDSPGVWEEESPRWPSAAVVCAVYGDDPEPWNAALRDAGLDSRHRRWSDDAIRAALGAFWARTGRLPRSVDLGAEGWSGPSARTLRQRYGTIAGAWRLLAPVPVDDPLTMPAASAMKQPVRAARR